MKKTTVAITLLLAVIFLGRDAMNQTGKANHSKMHYSAAKQCGGEKLYLDNAITVKLKPGLGDFSPQTGTVALGIPTLDEKLTRYNVYALDKRYRYDPEKMKSGMPDLSRIYRVTFPDPHSPEQVAAAFAADPNVEYAEPIPLNKPDDVPDDPMYAQCQHLPQIHAPEAWDIHKGENGTEEVIVAIVDNGTYWKHNDLAANIWQNLGEDADGDGVTLAFNGSTYLLDPGDINGIDDDGNGYADDLIGWDFGMNNNDPDHNWGENHGTHTAGIAAGVTDNGTGIASISWNISVMPVQVASADGTLPYGYDGIIYAAENGADAVSNSWSSPVYSEANQEAVTYAQQLGAVIFGSAGNINTTQLRYPASYTGVISVASVSVDDIKAAYSSYGPAVDISCPGGGTDGGILSTLPFHNYGLMSGTSQACPMTAGSFGLLKSYHPSWTNEELIIQFLGTADVIDSLNPDHANLLGTGRVNAFRFLSEENVVMPQQLKIDLSYSWFTDENANMMIEPGEEAYLNLGFRNYVPFVGDDNATLTLSTDDPEIEILIGTAPLSIPADSSFMCMNQLKFKATGDAGPHFAQFTLTFETDIPVPWGAELTTEVLVAPGGAFVFEGVAGGLEYSGTFIKGVLDQLDIHNVYGNTYPQTLLGFDYVFVSHGNFGQSLSNGTMFTQQHALLFQEYLENGGNMFVDMGSMIGALDYNMYSNAAALKSLFGVQGNTINMISNPLDSLYGAGGSIMEGIHFTQSSQPLSWYVDDLTLAAGATATFEESGYGTVSCMNDGASTFGHKTFYLCYNLAGLGDTDPVNSRNNLLLQVLDFFEMLPEGYLLANFKTDITAGGTPLEVHFTDFTLGAEGYPVTSWQWDFDGDGVIDSYDENPDWTFESPGGHDVTLIVTNALTTDTLTKKGCVMVNDGFLVYEGKAGGTGYSGTFIHDYMDENGFWSVTYVNELPSDLRGFWAVFLSFGNYDSENTVLSDGMADLIIPYLEDGGFVYLEGGDPLGFDQADNIPLLSLFGLNSAEDGTYNPIDQLKGLPGAATEGLNFTSTNQQALTYVDLYDPLEDAVPAFEETGYGIVGVQYAGEYDQRTFCFSYTLADLDDGEEPNTRTGLLERICGFFDMATTADEIVQGSWFDVQGYPNPTAGAYNICITLEEQMPVSVDVCDITGNIKITVPGQVLPAGEQVLKIDMTDLPAGIYLWRVRTGTESAAGKLVKAH